MNVLKSLAVLCNFWEQFREQFAVKTALNIAPKGVI